MLTIFIGNLFLYHYSFFCLVSECVFPGRADLVQSTVHLLTVIYYPYSKTFYYLSSQPIGAHLRP